jgi:hypothetical protein
MAQAGKLLSEWVAPMIGWLAVMAMLFAIVGVLLNPAQ